MLNPEMQSAAPPPEAAAPKSALRERLLDPRTLISFAILAVVLFVVLTHVKLYYGLSLRALRQTNPTLFPYTTLFRSDAAAQMARHARPGFFGFAFPGRHSGLAW